MESRDMECWRGDEISTKALLTPPYSLLPHGLARPSSLILLTLLFLLPAAAFSVAAPSCLPLYRYPISYSCCCPPSCVSPVCLLRLLLLVLLWYYSVTIFSFMTRLFLSFEPSAVSTSTGSLVVAPCNTLTLLLEHQVPPPKLLQPVPLTSSLLLLLVPPSSCCGAPQTSGRHKVTSTIRDVLNSPSHQYK